MGFRERVVTAVSTHHVRTPQHLVLDARNHREFQAVLCQRRGVVVEVPQGWIAVAWAIRGGIQLESGITSWPLARGRYQVWRDVPLQCRSLDGNSWVLLAAHRALWARAFCQGLDWADVLPGEGRVRLDFGQPMIGIARACIGEPEGKVRLALHAVAGAIRDAQQPLRDPLPRCAGRSQMQRFHNLSRLLRIRHHLRHTLDRRVDLAELARLANYSPSHLNRVHQRVFGETPFEYANRLRHESAWHHVLATGLPVHEIATRLGYESRSAFCRAFKSVFGTTTSDVRARAADGAQSRAA